MATISIKRLDEQRVDRRRAYRVILDDQKAGKINSGQSVDFDVDSGPHKLQLKIDWCSSAKLKVDVGEEEQATFVCKPRASQPSRIKLVVEGIYLMTIGRKRYIDLHLDERNASQLAPS